MLKFMSKDITDFANTTLLRV